jgi:hypothetical protein
LDDETRDKSIADMAEVLAEAVRLQGIEREAATVPPSDLTCCEFACNDLRHGHVGAYCSPCVDAGMQAERDAHRCYDERKEDHA